MFCFIFYEHKKWFCLFVISTWVLGKTFGLGLLPVALLMTPLLYKIFIERILTCFLVWYGSAGSSLKASHHSTNEEPSINPNNFTKTHPLYDQY
jgi:hypothetical protein